jgi:exodeoxyribonuclease V alpha subunit
MEELELAYALTVHKSQGCEFPVVVIPMLKYLRVLTTRNLLYTALTRAKTAVVIVGSKRIMNAMVDNNSGAVRNSGLALRLRALWDFDQELMGELR